jgi:heme/copper-type cytochrome/quinol oxidase subunit 1
MAEQNFKNHTRMVPLFHYVAFSLVLFALVTGVIKFIKAVSDESGRLNAAAMVALVLGVLLALWFARSFAIKAQDRAISAEENFRHYILTGKPFAANLKMGQIIALRFASDTEFVALAKKAVDEKLSAKQIKEAIQNWKADYNRV